MIQQARLDGHGRRDRGPARGRRAAARSAAPSTIPTWRCRAADAPDAATEKALRKRLDDAEFEEHARASQRPRPGDPGGRCRSRPPAPTTSSTLQHAHAEAAGPGATAATAATLVEPEPTPLEPRRPSGMAELDAAIAALADAGGPA